MKSKSLKGKNIVITGASSGIGKAAALAFARLGANLVLAARRQLLLEELAKECRRFGVEAFALKMDVTKLDSVQNLLEFTLTKLGSIDIWINNAGVGVVGEYTRTPMEAHEQVIKTNLLGYMYGTYVILPYFKDRRKGQIINNISLGAFIANPYAAAYSASKFGLRGFSEAIRAELYDYPEVYISDIFPAFIDTPGFMHAGNYVGKRIRPAPPIIDPFEVAQTMVRVVFSPRDQTLVGHSGRVAKILNGLAPRLVGNFMAKMFRTYLKRAEKVPKSAGNLFRPIWRGVGTHGGEKASRTIKDDDQRPSHLH